MSAETQLIIRFPESLAGAVRRALDRGKEGMDVRLHPEETPKFSLAEPNRSSVKLGEKTYPALIGRLPCNIETHKTFDHVHYYKAGDIAEMVHVFETEEERDLVQFEMGQVEGYHRTYRSGITPPTAQIIRRKFLKTRTEKPKPVCVYVIVILMKVYKRYMIQKEVVSMIEKEIQDYVASEDVVEEYEEVVDFEEYMADADNPDGCTFTFKSAVLGNENAIFQNHPESSDKSMIAAIEEREKNRAQQALANSAQPSLAEEKLDNEVRVTVSSMNHADAKVGLKIHEEEASREKQPENSNESDNRHEDSNATADDNNEDSGSDSDDEAFLNDLESGVQSDD